MFLKSSRLGRLTGKQNAVGAHARPTPAQSGVLGFAGPAGTSLEELLGDVTGRGEHRYAPSMVAWMREQYEAALADADDWHVEAGRALDCEQRLRVIAADIRHWLVREAGVELDQVDALRNGEYCTPDGPGVPWASAAPEPGPVPEAVSMPEAGSVPEQPQFSAGYTTVYTQRPLGLADVRPAAPEQFGDDAPLYGHWVPEEELGGGGQAGVYPEFGGAVARGADAVTEQLSPVSGGFVSAGGAR